MLKHEYFFKFKINDIFIRHNLILFNIYFFFFFFFWSAIIMKTVLYILFEIKDWRFIYICIYDINFIFLFSFFLFLKYLLLNKRQYYVFNLLWIYDDSLKKKMIPREKEKTTKIICVWFLNTYTLNLIIALIINA